MEESGKQRYTAIRVLSRGGMAEVELVRDAQTGRYGVRKRAKSTAAAMDALAREARLLAQLCHPQIPRLVEYRPAERCLIMEYMPGETLEQRFLREGPFAPEQIITWGIDLCELLAHLHDAVPAIIYRDLKPGNVIVMEDGRLALIDLGAARRYQKGKQRDTCLLGTCGYAAPELYGGLGQSGPQSDVYSLGAMLYQLWDRTRPHSALAGVLRHATGYGPSDRYPNCAQMKEALMQARGVKNRSASFFLRAAVLFGCVILSLGMLCVRYEEGLRYAQLLAASRKERGEARWALCVQAIQIRPQAKDAYLCLLQAFAEDGCFDEQEERFWKQEVALELEALKQSDGYAAVAYAMGELYWYGYGQDDGQMQIAPEAMKASIPWFQDVLQHAKETTPAYQNAMIYQTIGCFYRDIVLSMRMSDEAGRFRACWEALCALRQAIEMRPLADVWMRLQLDQLMIDFVMGYLWELRTDGVTKGEVVTVLAEGYERIHALSAQSEQERALKARLLEQEEMVWKTVESTYAQEMEQEVKGG